MKYTLTKTIRGMEVSVHADTMAEANEALEKALDTLNDRDDGMIEGKDFAYKDVKGYVLFNGHDAPRGPLTGDKSIIEKTIEEAFEAQKEWGNVKGGYIAEVRRVVKIEE